MIGKIGNVSFGSVCVHIYSTRYSGEDYPPKTEDGLKFDRFAEKLKREVPGTIIKDHTETEWSSNTKNPIIIAPRKFKPEDKDTFDSLVAKALKAVGIDCKIIKDNQPKKPKPLDVRGIEKALPFIDKICEMSSSYSK